MLAEHREQRFGNSLLATSPNGTPLSQSINLGFLCDVGRHVTRNIREIFSGFQKVEIY